MISKRSRTCARKVSLAGVSLPPIGADCVGGTGEPFLIAAVLFDVFAGEELWAVARRMPERFQQPGCDKNGNLMWFKSEQPRRFGGVQSRGGELSIQEFRPLFLQVHGAPIFTNLKA